MFDLPVAALLATDAVRRQFDPAAPPEPERARRSSRPVRHVRSTAAAALRRVARVVEPRPECTPAH